MIKSLRKLFLLAFTPLLLASCNQNDFDFLDDQNYQKPTHENTQTGEEGEGGEIEPLVPTGEVTVYFCISEIGRYDGQPGKDVESLYLENCVPYTGTIGDPLPGGDKVTTIVDNVAFECWQTYEGLGAPTVYTNVPEKDGVILYAKYKANNTSGEGGADIPYVGDFVKFYADTSMDNGDNWSAMAYLGVYAFGYLGNEFLSVTMLNDHLFSFDVDVNKYHTIIFVKASSEFVDWECIIGQTIDMRITPNFNCLRVTSIKEDNIFNAVWTNYEG